MNIIFICILVLSGLTIPIRDGDTFFHLAVGKEIIENGFITKDPFSIHLLNYSPQQWLSDFIFYGIYSFGGYTLLYVFQYVFIVFFVVILYLINKNLNNNPKQNIIFSILGLVLFSGLSLSIRPQIFTYILFIIQIYLLEKFINTYKTKYLVRLLLLTIISVNLHIGYFPMMIILIFPYIVESFINVHGRIISIKNYGKALKLLLLIPGMILAGCFNPYGISKLLYFKTLSDKYLTSYVCEWQAPGFSHTGLLIFSTIFVTAFILIVSSKPVHLRYLLLLGGLSFMSLNSVRYFIYFALALSLFCNLHFRLDFKNNAMINRIFYKFNIHSIVYISAIILVIILKSIYSGWIVTNFSQFPVKAVSYISSHEPQKRIFNEYNDGSYLLYNDISVFIDSRADLYSSTLNNTTILQDYCDMYLGKLHCNEIIKKYDIERILTKKGSIISTYISSNTAFVKVYEDTKYIIYDKVKE